MVYTVITDGKQNTMTVYYHLAAWLYKCTNIVFPVFASFPRLHKSLCNLKAIFVSFSYLTAWGQRSHSHTVPFQPDIQGHLSAAVKGKNKHFYCAAFSRLLSPASCSLKINMMGVVLIGQHLLVPGSLSIVPVPIGILLLWGHEWFVVSVLL